MRILIESTAELVTLEGVPCRVWSGVTEEGTPCIVYVHRVASESAHEAEFSKELVAQRPSAGETEDRLVERMRGARALRQVIEDAIERLPETHCELCTAAGRQNAATVRRSTLSLCGPCAVAWDRTDGGTKDV
jgi:hypothetical protein